MISPTAAIFVVFLVIAAFSFGEWIGQQRERIRWQRKANVLDFTPRLRRVK